jgi:hypothetical protein
MVIFGETHLRRILSTYAAYYNQARTHLALQKDAPLHRAVTDLVALSRFLSWQGYITNTSGYDFRKGHQQLKAARACHSRQQSLLAPRPLQINSNYGPDS